MAKTVPPGRVLAKQKFHDKKKRKYAASTISNAAYELGRMGGIVGGHARAAALSGERRSEIASHSANARWKKECFCNECQKN